VINIGLLNIDDVGRKKAKIKIVKNESQQSMQRDSFSEC
jgi:hypothetical protein